MKNKIKLNRRKSNNIKKAPPDPEKSSEKKECYVCKHHPENPNIEIGNLVKILTVNNGNCGLLKPGDIVRVEDVILRELSVIKLWLTCADCWVNSGDCTWVKVCSGCGEQIQDKELLT